MGFVGVALRSPQGEMIHPHLLMDQIHVRYHVSGHVATRTCYPIILVFNSLVVYVIVRAIVVIL